MNKSIQWLFRSLVPFGLLTVGLTILAQVRAVCQYRTTELTPIPNQSQDVFTGKDTNPNNYSSDTGPVRLARFAYVKGDVSWRPDSGSEWAQATANLPIRQGEQIWVTHGGRAEIQFDDGSDLRLGNGTLVTLKALYSDADGEFTQVTLTNGLAALSTRHDHSIYQIDSPDASVIAGTRCRLRLGCSNGLDVGVRQGNCTIEDQHEKATLVGGQYCYVPDPNSPLTVRNLPAEDNWDHWNDTRDHYLYDDVPTYHHVPSNIALVSGDLDSYGNWRDDPHYGWVWAPRPRHRHWRPYSDGHWTWVEPYGWTWVADDPWGWAPYHYGTWVAEPYGWAWCPGPVHQYWSPAVVSFSFYNGSVCWAPLAPAEVTYPATLAVGFAGNGWSLFFSIGQAGCYYPAGPSYCVGVPFNNVVVNRFTYVNNVTNITNVYNGYAVNTRFIPRNARFAAGATVATASAFGGRGAYRPVANATTYFKRGRLVGAPPAGRSPVFGPPAARPTRLAMTPTRSFATNVRPPAVLLHRSVFRAPQPGARPGQPVLAHSPSARRPSGSFASTIARVPNQSARNAFIGRNMAPAAAARNARAALSLNNRTSHAGKAGGSFAAARRSAPAVSTANRPRPATTATTRRSAAHKPASQGRSVRSATTHRQSAHTPVYRPRPHNSAAHTRRQASNAARAHARPSHSGGTYARPHRQTSSRPGNRLRAGSGFSRPPHGGSFQAPRHTSRPGPGNRPSGRETPPSHRDRHGQ